MKHTFGEIIVLSLGGSVICPDDINSRFIREFKYLVERFVKKGIKFVITPGGGGVCRVYQKAAGEVTRVTDDDKDWIGIHATRLNAALIRTTFRKIANPVVLDSRGKIKKLTYPVTVAAGWRPGWSTDYVAAALAHDFRAKEMVNIGKPAFVYDKNPDTHKNAKPIYEMTWKEYRTKAPKKWSPGLHAPVDPVAAKLCEKSAIAMFVVGPDLKNLSCLLEGKEFEGTYIQ
ncbi:MAG: UMP kinase [Patescibacteria group bacterium]|nr:UMP kinase [Patescibacteria group bacterium]